MYAQITDASGCKSNIIAVPLTVTASPNAGVAAAPINLCFATSGLTNITLANLLSGETGGGTWASIGDNAGANFNTAAGTLNPNNLNSGNYIFEYSVGGGNCPITTSEVNVNVAQRPTATTSIMAMTCFNSNNAELTVTGSSTIPPYLYNIGSGSQSNPTFANLSTGTYVVTVTDNVGCSTTVSATITTPPQLVVSCAQVSPASSGNNGVGSVTINGGTANYDIDWSGQSTGNLSNVGTGASNLLGLGTGTYNVTVTDNNGCTTPCDFTLQPPSCALSATAVQVQPVSCFGGANGQINLTVSNAPGSVTYAWSDGLGAIEDPQNVPAGNYTVTVTSGPCQVVANVTVTQPAAALNVATTQVSVCPNETTTVDITVTGGTTNYSYVWNTNATTQDLQNMPSGNYIVTVTDARNCTSSFVVDVLEYSLPTLSYTATLPTCINQSCVSLITNNNNAISWSAAGASGTNACLDAGLYSVSVTDQNGCEKDTTIIISSVPPLSFNCQVVSNVTVIGGSDGVIGITTSSVNRPPYQVQWGNGSTAFVIDGDSTIHNLTAGVYTITVTDNFGCQDSCELSLTDPSCAMTAMLTQTGFVVCNNENTGAIQTTIANAPSAVTYDWNIDTYDGMQNLTNIPADNYVVTITSGACQIIQSIDIQQPPALLLNCNVLNNVTTPNGSDGAAELTFSGGTAPYQITWNSGMQNQSSAGVINITNLIADNYDILISDDNGCQQTCSFSITNPNCITVYDTISTLSCNPSDTGSVTILLVTNIGCDSLLTVNTALSAFSQTNLNAMSCNPAGVGIDTLILQNFLGCDSLVITNTTLSSSVVTNLTNSTCDPNNVGIFRDTLQSTFGCDSIIINTITLNPSSVTNLTATTCNPAGVGIDTLILQNFLGCDSLVITNTTLSSSVVTNLTNSTCNPNNVGIFRDTLQSTFGCDSIIINTVTLNPSSVTNLTATTCNPAGVGIDTLILQNFLGCDSLVITNTTFSALPITNIVATTCDPFGVGVFRDTLTTQVGCDSIVIQTITLSPQSITNLTATSCDPANVGRDTLVLQNHLGCDSLVITNTTLINPSVFNLNTILCGEQTINVNGTVYGGANLSGTEVLAGQAANGCDSIVHIQVTMGTAVESYIFEQLCAGESITIRGVEYNESNPTGTIILQNLNGCDTFVHIAVTFRYLIADFATQSPTCNGDENGSIILDTVFLGNPPYSFSTDGENFSTMAFPFVQNNLASGQYTIYIQDADNCTLTSSVSVPSPPLLIMDLGENLNLEFGDSVRLQGQANFIIDSLSWAYTGWMSCDTCLSTFVRPLETTKYALTLWDENNCEVRDVVTVVVKRDNAIFVPSAFTPNNDGFNDYFTIFASSVVKKINTLRVYDRWGESLFIRNNFLPNVVEMGWDGTFKGSILNPAVFVYYAEVEYIDGSTEIIKGDVTLLQ